LIRNNRGKTVLLKCTECGVEVSSSAEVCPRCGAQPPGIIASAIGFEQGKKRTYRIKWITRMLIVAAAAGLLVHLGNGELTPEERAEIDQRRAETAALKAKEEQKKSEERKLRDAENRELAWVHKGKSAVKEILKDPESAKFKNVYFFRGDDGVPVTCGEVNSRNSFGGYAGFERFVSGGYPHLTYVETQVVDFSELWDRFCTK